MDVYDPSLGPDPVQIHDLNPGILPSGLFWTTAIDDDGIQVHLGKGAASMRAHRLPIEDYTDFGNALFGGGPAPVPGHVSFNVVWHGVDERVRIRNTDPAIGIFAGEFVRNKAQMDWKATVGDFRFVSDPLETSVSSFAEIGHERNGIFFR